MFGTPPNAHEHTPPAPLPPTLRCLSISQYWRCFRQALYIHLVICRRLVIARTVAVLLWLLHVVEGLYAYTLAHRAGHKDTAPLWFIQTTIIGYPSTCLAMQHLK